MYPGLLVVLGVLVLLLGSRLSILGAAVGALLGVVFLNLFSVAADPLFQIGFVILLAVGGFFLTGLAKGIVDIVLAVLCALAGAAIVLGFIDLFNFTLGWMEWLFAILGGLAGWMVFRSFREMALIILTGLIGGLLVTRGLTVWLPVLQGWLGTLLAIVLAGGSIGYQSGFFAKRKAAAQEKAEAAQAQAAAAQPPATAAQPPATAAQPPAAPLQAPSDGTEASTTPTTSGG
jgi:hypothetical protein